MTLENALELGPLKLNRSLGHKEAHIALRYIVEKAICNVDPYETKKIRRIVRDASGGIKPVTNLVSVEIEGTFVDIGGGAQVGFRFYGSESIATRYRLDTLEFTAKKSGWPPKIAVLMDRVRKALVDYDVSQTERFSVERTNSI